MQNGGNLREFITDALLDIVGGVEDARKQAQYDIQLLRTQGRQTVEFDLAVTAESADNDKALTGINVVGLIKMGGELTSSTKNSSISRIQFGVYINPRTSTTVALLLLVDGHRHFCTHSKAKLPRIDVRSGNLG